MGQEVPGLERAISIGSSGTSRPAKPTEHVSLLRSVERRASAWKCYRAGKFGLRHRDIFALLENQEGPALLPQPRHRLDGLCPPGGDRGGGRVRAPDDLRRWRR